jgi:hypothetical protein
MSPITGREPRLSRGYAERGTRRLLPRRFASLLNKINPHDVSLEAVAAALESDEFFVRYNAGKLLARRADREARFLCEDVLRNGSVQARASVARHLYGFSWYVGEALYRTAFADSDAREELLDRGVYVSGFGFPVVPQGQARLRCQISAAHEREHLDRAIGAITDVAGKHGILAS